MKKKIGDKQTLQQTIERQIKKENSFRILLIIISCLVLLFLGIILGTSEIPHKIIGSIQGIFSQNETDTEIQEVKEEINKVEEPETEEEESEDAEAQVEEEVKETPVVTKKKTTPVAEPEETTPVLKCSQYDYDFATAYIEAAEQSYVEQYALYLKEQEEYEDCMYGKTYNQLYAECDSSIGSLITNPTTRGNLIRQCIDNYYSTCEMNNSSDWYATNLAKIQSGIQEQQAVLDSCY